MDRKGKLDYRNSPLTEGASQNSSIPAKRPRFAMAAAPAQPPADRAEIADVAVIGAGVVGCAVARRLTLPGARVVVAERAVDVLDGASRGTSGILHTGLGESGRASGRESGGQDV